MAAHYLIINLFLVFFLAGTGVVLLSRRREWQRKYLDYRALAEGLRVQSYWRRAGIVDLHSPVFAHDNFMQKQDVELGWIRNVMRSASLEGLLDPAATGPEQVDAVIREWIGTTEAAVNCNTSRLRRHGAPDCTGAPNWPVCGACGSA